MRSIVKYALAAALVAGCASQSQQSLVVVSVDADAPLADVATLHVRATVADQTREFDVHPTGGATLSIPPAQTFGIDLPRSMSGTLALHVEARDSSDAVVASGDGSGPIHVGARADISLMLAAAASGSDMGEDGGGDIGAVDMARPTGDMVVIPPAMLTIDKTTQSFGDITVGKTSTTASFLVVNAGGMASSVAMLTTGGANLAEFNIDTDCGPSLAPGGRCHVTATVSPTSAGMKTATFALAAAQGGSVGGTLTANALTPGAVKILQASGDCGSSLIGTQSTTTASFTVQNSGATPTSALTVMMSDPQFTASGCSGVTLAANATCTVTVKFKPSSSGTQNASLTVSATTGGTDTASVVGVGLKPAALKLSPTSYAFATTARGSSGETATFTVSNDGDVASATLSAATVTGANISSFVITADNCKGAPVGPAPATCTIAVQFKPQQSGPNSASLSIPSSGLPTVSLTGTGTPIWVAETPPAGTPQLNAVWAADPDNVYAVGQAGTILYRPKSGGWSAQSLTGSSPPDLTAVSGSSSTNIFIAGSAMYQSSGNGQWSSTLTIEPFTGVWANSSADVWATWDTGSTDPNNGNGVYHYTPGGGWQLARDASNNALHGSTSVWGTGASDIFIYGGWYMFQISTNSFWTVGDVYHLGAAEQFTTQFQQKDEVTPQNVSMAVRSLWGFGAPAAELYAVTTVIPSSMPTNVILHSKMAGVWDQMPSPAPTALCNGVWGWDTTHVFFACDDGVHLYDGVTWSSSLPSTTSSLRAISGSNVALPNVYAVGTTSDGTGGVIYHYY